MQWLTPDWKALPLNMGAMVTCRQGGESRGPYGDAAGMGGCNLGDHVGDDPVAVAANRAALARQLPGTPAWLAQVHGTHVVDAAVARPGEEADASVTDKPGVVCVVMTADCLPVLFADAAGKVVGAAHAGWRGLAAGVLENTLAAMRARGADHIHAWLGPAIGPAHFEVGEDVLQAFVQQDPQAASAFVARPDVPGKFLADIYLLASQRLMQAGVAGISGGGFCTVTDHQRFYSYRRDKTTGRMASLIWLK